MCCVCLMTQQQQEDEKKSNFLIKTKCNHVMCQECVETIVSHSSLLLKERRISTWEDLITQHPTQSKCPYCRSGFSIFDIQPLNHNVLNNDDFIQKSEIPLMLNGSVYAIAKKIGYQSIHFPSLLDTNSSTLPYIRIDQDGIINAMLPLSQPKKQSKNIHFEPGYSFHKKSNTFYGILKLNNVSQTFVICFV